jgi:oligopeptide transport system substrate-binding protein
MYMKKLLMCALIALTAVAVFAEGQRDAPAAAAQPKILNFNIGTEPPELDPQITTDTTSFMILNLTIEGLVRYDQNNALIAAGATSWTISPDGLVYTFTLRKGTKWSNGADVTSADYVYGIKRALDPATASQYAYILYDIKNAEDVNAGKLPVDQLGIKAIGADKVEITLARPTAYFLSIMAFGTALPCNEAFFKANSTNYGAEAATLLYNGPYTIKEWKHEDRLILQKNPVYWNAAAIKLDGLQGYMIRDNATAKVKFFNKELDLIGVPGTDFKEYMDKGYKLADYSDGATFYLEFNTTDPLMANANIRKAFSYAIDRTAYIRDVMKDHSQVALGYVVPILPGKGASFRAEVGDLLKDNAPVEAKALLAKGLAEVGIANPKFTIIMDDGDVQRVRGAALQDMWRKNLGIEVEFQQMPFKARLQKMTDKDFQIVFAGWGPDYNDPMTFLDVFLTGGGNNHTYYASPAYDKLIQSAKNDPNPATRMATMYAAEKMLMADMPIAPIFFRMRTWTAQDGVTGVVRRAIGGDPDFYYADKK